jgi:plastocyanin
MRLALAPGTLAAAAAALALAGVGSPKAASSSTGPLHVAADPSGKLRFDKTTLSAKAGKITIAFTNNSTTLHNIAIRSGPKCHVDTKCAGLTALDIGSTDPFIRGHRTLTVTLKPGTYRFFCGVPGHEAGGMQGTLTVSP